MKNLFKKTLPALFLFCLATSAQAEEKSMSASVLLGYGFASNGFNSVAYGLEFDTQISPLWSVGLYWSVTKKPNYSGSNAIGGLVGDFVMTPVMLHANYTFARFDGVYAGPRLGFISQKSSNATIAYATTDFAVGAQVGYDFDLLPDWTVGIQGNWNLIVGSATSSLFNLMVPISYHL